MKRQEVMLILLAIIMKLILPENASAILNEEERLEETINRVIDDFVDSKNRKSEIMNFKNAELQILDLRPINYANVPLRQQSGQVNYKYIITMLKTKGLTWITITDLSKLIKNIDDKTLTTTTTSETTIITDETITNLDTTTIESVTINTIESTVTAFTDEITENTDTEFSDDFTETLAEVFSDPDSEPAALKKERRTSNKLTTKMMTTRKIQNNKSIRTAGKIQQTTTKRSYKKEITSTTKSVKNSNQLQWWEAFIYESRKN